MLSKKKNEWFKLFYTNGLVLHHHKLTIEIKIYHNYHTLQTIAPNKKIFVVAVCVKSTQDTT